jgi:hypothetical protein
LFRNYTRFNDLITSNKFNWTYYRRSR